MPLILSRNTARSFLKKWGECYDETPDPDEENHLILSDTPDTNNDTNETARSFP